MASYKQKYLDGLDELGSLRYQLRRLQEDRDKLESEYVKVKAELRTHEGNQSQIRNESEWLRDTLRLVIVPVGKEAEIAKQYLEEKKQQGFI